MFKFFNAFKGNKNEAIPQAVKALEPIKESLGMGIQLMGELEAKFKEENEFNDSDRAKYERMKNILTRGGTTIERLAQTDRSFGILLKLKEIFEKSEVEQD